MNKFWVGLIASVFALSLTGCGGAGEPTRELGPRAVTGDATSGSGTGNDAGGGATDGADSQSPVDDIVDDVTDTVTDTVGDVADIVDGILDPIQKDVIEGTIGTVVGGLLPEPLDATVLCLTTALNTLIDAPDAVLTRASQQGALDDPAGLVTGSAADIAASLESFAGQLQGTATALVDGGSCGTADGSAQQPSLVDTLAGTDLESLGPRIIDILVALGNLGDNPDLATLTATITPLLIELANAFDQLPAELRDAPVVGDLLDTLQVAINDVAGILPALAAVDLDGTLDAVALTLNNLTSNLLFEVLPVADIDALAGTQVGAELQSAIDAATAVAGDDLATLVNDDYLAAIEQATVPIISPYTGLVSEILGENSALDGILLGAAGDGQGQDLDVLTYLVLAAQSGTPLAKLPVGIGLVETSSPTANLSSLMLDTTTVDSVIGTMATLTDLGMPLSDVVDTVLGVTGDVDNAGVADALADLIAGLINSGGDTGDSTDDAVDDTVDDVVDDTTDAVDDVVDDVTDTVDDVTGGDTGDTVDDVIDDVTDTVDDVTGGDTGDTVDDVVDDTTDTVDDVVDDVTDTVDDVTGGDTGDTVDDVVDDTTDTVDDTTDTVGDVVDDVTDVVDDTTGGGTGDVTDVVDDTTDTVGDVVDDVTGGDTTGGDTTSEDPVADLVAALDGVGDGDATVADQQALADALNALLGSETVTSDEALQASITTAVEDALATGDENGDGTVTDELAAAILGALDAEGALSDTVDTTIDTTVDTVGGLLGG